MTAPNDSLNSTYLNYFSFLTSGNKNQRSVWLTCAWTPWSCLCCGAVAACTSPRPSRSTWGWGSRRSWSDHPPPCAPWRLMLPKPRDSGSENTAVDGGGVEDFYNHNNNEKTKSWLDLHSGNVRSKNLFSASETWFCLIGSDCTYFYLQHT